ncbi:hypothetical protein HYC85_023885 [Camellia sinensis]|uniref:Uncharacterized protein n=1 Tax=Camellia sinensis TaxID=4442 RepID=A0A7J7GJM8_CAMSI|nr:hypothetical protein HYC85_023885 [Camellia sinensis]
MVVRTYTTKQIVVARTQTTEPNLWRSHRAAVVMMAGGKEIQRGGGGLGYGLTGKERPLLTVGRDGEMVEMMGRWWWCGGVGMDGVKLVLTRVLKGKEQNLNSGIRMLVRSDFSVLKAHFFNFVSALVALARTTLALVMGQDQGQSSLIEQAHLDAEGFMAGGFVYIAVAKVLAEMNNGSSSAIKSTVLQLTSLISGMTITLYALEEEIQ